MTKAPTPPEIFKFAKEGDILEGIFEGFVDSEVGEGKIIKNAIVLDDEGKRHQIALNTTLAYYFGLPKVGAEIQLVFEGKRPFKHPKLGMTQKNSYMFSYR